MAEKVDFGGVIQEQIMAFLENSYKLAIGGSNKVNILGFEKSAKKIADEYIKQHKDVEKAIDAFVNAQLILYGGTGFVSNIGGLITLPVALPANIAGVTFFQIRMITVIASMRGYDVESEQVKTLTYLCLIGLSLAEAFKVVGLKITSKITQKLMSKIPGAIFIKINKMVGFRLITKAGTKGILNLAKAIPIVSGVVGGAIDVAATSTIANTAKNTFVVNNEEDDDIEVNFEISEDTLEDVVEDIAEDIDENVSEEVIDEVVEETMEDLGLGKLSFEDIVEETPNEEYHGYNYTNSSKQNE